MLYLDGIITVERRTHDWMAFITGDRKLWDCSPNSADEAVENLLRTHPKEVVAASKRHN